MSEPNASGPPLTRRGVLRGGAAAAGLAAAGSVPASAQETVSYGDWFTDEALGGAVGNFDGTTVDRTGRGSVTVQVGSRGNGGPFGFGPPAVRVDPGTTVTFEWVSDTHNLVVAAQPAAAGWGGHQPVEDAGFTVEHTFETEGLYTYYCEPHLQLGMKAAIVVGDAEVEAPAGAGGTPWVPPGGDTGLAFMGVLLGTAGLAVTLMAAGEGATAVRRWHRRAATAAEAPLAEAEPDADVVRELDHDAFAPVGTATLVLLYLLVLVTLWVFVYFVEFLGNGPTVVG